MLCDRDADAFSRLPTEEAFQAYVREHFSDKRTGSGGAECDNMFCCVRRNAVYAKHPWSWGIIARYDWRFLRLHVPLRWRTAGQPGAGSGATAKPS